MDLEDQVDQYLRELLGFLLDRGVLMVHHFLLVRLVLVVVEEEVVGVEVVEVVEVGALSNKHFDT
ncbi:hypothetical protein [Salmonella sp. s54412]|uniref:hypothetical protein n=1 Tax=Salmonella sp. s54412 TaxID=3160128 RepID=UPI003754C103